MTSTGDAHAQTTPGQPLCVLLLEDNDADAFLAKRALSGVRRVGSVVRAKNGEEAISLIAEGKINPDFAFVDLQMPTMNGLDFLTESVDRGLANIPMVVLTSSSAVGDALKSRVRGALRVMVKPEDPDDLRRALEEAINAFAKSEPGAPDWIRQPWPTVSPPSADAGGPPRAPQPAGRPFGRRSAPARP